MVLEQFVYVVQMGQDGPIKVGIAANPRARLKQMQTGNPVRLRLLMSFNGGAALERELHGRLASHRMSGEWFRPHPEVLEIIREERYCGGRSDSAYSTRYPQCDNCGVLMGGPEDESEAKFCSACDEFAAMREGGGDPFEDAA